jgi:hypothetical protein
MMANEISLTIGLDRKDGTKAKPSVPIRTVRGTQTVKRHYSLVKAVGTTEESVDFSTFDITTNGMIHLYNNNATNFVEWGTTSGDYPGRLEAGDVPGSQAVLQLNAGKTLYLKANTAACDVEITMFAK